MTPKDEANRILDEIYLILDEVDCTHSLNPYIKKLAKFTVNETLKAIKADQPENPESQEICESYYKEVIEEIEKS